jgi:hypothetical protein
LERLSGNRKLIIGLSSFEVACLGKQGPSVLRCTACVPVLAAETLPHLAKRTELATVQFKQGHISGAEIPPAH